MARGKKWPKLKAGQAIAVYWHDIVGSSTGDPEDSSTAYSLTLGFFHGWTKLKGKRCLRTHLTRYPGGHPKEDTPIGYDTYPVNIIEKIVALDFTEEPYEEAESSKGSSNVQAVSNEPTTKSSLRSLPTEPRERS